MEEESSECSFNRSNVHYFRGCSLLSEGIKLSVEVDRSLKVHKLQYQSPCETIGKQHCRTWELSRCFIGL